MTALAVAGLAAPVAAQSSAPLESAAPVAERPMLAPEGWMFTIVESRRGSRVQIEFLAVAPDGDIRSVATIDDVVRDPGVGRDLRTAYQWWETTIATVTTDGFLPVPLERNDDSVDVPMLLRVFDLLAPDPAVMATDLERTPERL